MIVKRIFILCCALPLFGSVVAQRPDAEAEYLRADSALWTSYEAAMREIYEGEEQGRRERARALFDSTRRRNRELALRYAATPSGLKRCYMTRLDTPKDSLRAALRRIPRRMRRSPYSRSIALHLRTRQLAEGDRAVALGGWRDADGSAFDWSSLRGRCTLLLYGGLDCMGGSGREYLADLAARYADDLRIVVFWPTESPEKLAQLQAAYSGVPHCAVSDFRGDHTPFKIRYGAQATPTSFLVSPDRTIRVKSEGLAPGRIDEVLAGINKQVGQ